MVIGDKIRLLVDYKHYNNLEFVVIPKGTIGKIIEPLNEQFAFHHKEYILVGFDILEELIEVYIYDPMETIYCMVDDEA